MLRPLIAGLAAGIALCSAALAGWSDWEPVGDKEIKGTPSIVSYGPSDKTFLAVIVRGEDDKLWWSGSNNGTNFGPWKSLGGELSRAPSCVSPAARVIDCYVAGADGTLFQIYRDGSNWSGFIPHDVYFTTNAAVTAPNSDIRAILGGMDGHLGYAYWAATDGWWMPTQGAHPFGKGFENVSLSKNERIACDGLAGNSLATADEQAFQETYFCIIREATGAYRSLAWSRTLGEGKGPMQDLPLDGLEPSPHGPSVVLLKTKSGLVATVAVVGDDKQMRIGNYRIGKGWAGSFETIGDGQFASSPSCDLRIGAAKGTINMVCAGRGTDGRVWVSTRTTN